MCENNLVPNLFVIGAPKSGTSAFVDGLGQHPSIYVGEKEPRYFDAPVYYDFEEDYPVRSLAEYVSLYTGAKEGGYKYRIDASVFNMYSEASLSKIKTISPDAKFIVLLRDPLSACISMHQQRLKYLDSKMREVSEDFLECWNLLSDRQQGLGYPKGCRNKFLFRYDLLYSYQNYIDMIIDVVGAETVLFFDYQDFKLKGDLVYKTVFDFLELDEICVKKNLVNESYVTEKNILNSLIYSFAVITRGTRDWLGLTGEKVDFFKRLIRTRRPTKINPLELDSNFGDYFIESKAKMDSVVVKFE